MRWLVSFLFLFLFSFQTKAAHDPFHAYVAFGITFTPSSYRIGSGDWEFGILNQVIGFDKIFDFGNGYYSSFGFVTNGNLGVYSAMGFKTKWWFIPIRCELSGYIDNTAFSHATALIGVTYGF